MVIAVMVSLSRVNATRADRQFFNLAISYLASAHAQHHYYICTDAPQEVVVNASNVFVQSASYIQSNSGWFSLWRQIKYKQLLKKLGAEMVLCSGVGSYARSRVPYCILIKPNEIERKPSGQLVKVLGRAKALLTFSKASKVLICQQYRVPAEKVGVVHAAASELLRPADEDLHAGVKERYTEGCEYFIYTGSFRDQSSLVDLLKAFSVFKKRQKSTWKLVLVNLEQGSSSAFMDVLRTYKYRDEVVVLEESEDLPMLLSAAYAFVYPSKQEDYGLYILEAMHFGLPVLTVRNPLIEEIAGEAALYYDESVGDLAEQMMSLYKDEDLRSRQIVKVKETEERFSWEKTAEEIWESLN